MSDHKKERYLKKLRTEGSGKIEFEMDNEFRDTFKQKEKRIEFKTHEELDLFVKSLMKIDPEILTKKKYKGEITLLKR